jgi:hypothetical protein
VLRQMGRGNCSNQQALKPEKANILSKFALTGSISSNHENKGVSMNKKNSLRKSGNRIIRKVKQGFISAAVAASLVLGYGDGLSPSV